MNFEEFFLKKKIDLKKFKEADKDMLEKLQNEYEQMGSKSFDHFYKFWFNRWRRKYLLITETN